MRAAREPGVWTRRRVAALVLGYLAGLAGMILVKGVFLSADRYFLILLVPAVALGVGRAYVRDFLPLDHASRMARYAMINECLPRFYNLNRPVIGALNSHAVGVGLVLAAFCDMRVASRDAFFACPEIDRGVLAGGGSFFTRHNMPSI